MRKLLVIVAAMTLGGCVSTAYHVVTAPVRVASFTVDKLTTSRAEADRNLGRKVRRQRERDAKAARREAKEARKAARRQERKGPDNAG